MMIQERLKRSNLIMLVVPVAVAGVLLAVGLGVLVLLLETIYLPRLGLTMQDLHTLGEQAEAAFADLKHFVVLYGVVVIAVLLAVGTNLWLTRNLFAHIREPLAVLMQGIHHIQNGDLNAPIANGPASLATPRPALSMATSQPVGFVLGATVLLALEGARMMMERKEQPGVPIVKGEK